MQMWNQGFNETQNVLLVSLSPKLKASWEGKYKKSFFLLRSMRARPYWSCLSLHSYYIEQWQVHIRCSVSCMTSNSKWLALFIPYNIKTASLIGLLLLLLLLSRFSRVRLCATPQMAAHQAPLSLGFSRQEHWSGLPLSSPMQESEKWKWSRSVVSDSSRPHGLQPTRSSIHGIFQARVLEWVAIAFSTLGWSDNTKR